MISHADSRGDWEAPPENDFRKTCDVEYAFIDFGSAHIFSPGDPPFASPITIPPDPISSPEQVEHDTQGYGEGKIDVFAADVYNLGKTLETAYCCDQGSFILIHTIFLNQSIGLRQRATSNAEI